MSNTRTRYAATVAALVLAATGAAAGAADIPVGAAACSGCHPAKAGVDTPVARLNGHNADSTVAAMLQFQSGARPSTVMGRIAKGFSPDEIKAIAAWFAAQKD